MFRDQFVRNSVGRYSNAHFNFIEKKRKKLPSYDPVIAIQTMNLVIENLLLYQDEVMQTAKDSEKHVLIQKGKYTLKIRSIFH